MRHITARHAIGFSRAPVAQAITIVLIALAVIAAKPTAAQDGDFAVDQRGEPATTVAPVVSGDGSSVIVTRQPTCVQGRFVLTPDGRFGYAVPVIGPTVLRGSQDAGPSTSLEVMRIDVMDPDMANSIVTCFGAR